MVYYLTTEFFARFLLLDSQWIANFLLNNIFWVFAFMATGYFFYQDKKLVLSFVFVVLSLWAVLDFTRATGWVVFDPLYLFLSPVTSIVVLAFAETDERLKKNMVVLNSLRFLLLVSVFNLFLR
jgi:integral membrane sensor domain MASE1